MGIVYRDEVDKFRGGSTPKARSPGCRQRAQQPGIDFDTSNNLFICGGAFVGLEDIIARRVGWGRFGYQLAEVSQVAADGSLLRQVKPEDLEVFGLIPEIIGRLPVIAPLDALGVDDLARILQSPKQLVRIAKSEVSLPLPRFTKGCQGPFLKAVRRFLTLFLPCSHRVKTFGKTKSDHFRANLAFLVVP